MNTKEFLQAIHQEKQINFRVINTATGDAKLINGLYNEETKRILEQFNKDGYEIFFSVNEGGTKDSEINKITSVFIDFDAGKDIDNMYFPLEYIQEYKQKKLETIHSYLFQPSFIVETRNGLHVYWLVDEGATIEQFRECQSRLIQYFDSDKAIKNPARVMRVPGYHWNKDKKNPFLSVILEQCDCRYNIKDIIKSLPEVNTIKPEISRVSRIVKSTPTCSNINIELIMGKDVQGLKRILGTSEQLPDGSILGGIEDNTFTLHYPLNTPLVVENRQQLYDVICKINLASFLGLQENRNFNCVFHNDKKPSANIFTNIETGHKVYKCFSASCDFVGTIIKIVERLQKCRKSEAINFIKQVYNIELVETEWQKETKVMLQSNIEYLLSNLMSVEYPNLYHRISYYIPQLITLHEFAIMNLHDEPLSNDSRHAFFTTLTQLKQVFRNLNNEKLTQRTALFAFLHLIEKLPDNKVPEKLLKQSKILAKDNHNTPNFFEIPPYDYPVLSNAESKAKEFKQRNMSMKGFSRDMLIRTMGSEEADKVYPKLKGRKQSKVMQDFSDLFDMLILESIEVKGYAIENEILSKLKGNRDENKKKIKRVLQETLDRYGLVRKRSNKQIKEFYGITNKGYPFLLVKE